MIKEKLINVKGWIIVIAIAVFTELILSNYSLFAIEKEEKIVLAEEQNIDSNKKFVLENTKIDQNIKNLMVDLSLINGDYAEVYIVVTDQGNKYKYAMPVTRIFPKVEETKYIDIYPYGKVNTIYIEVSVPEGTNGIIHQMTLNQPMDFSFKIIRCFFFLGILLAFNYRRLFPKWEIPEFNPKDKKQRIITGIICIMAILGAIWIARSNPRCVEEPWVHHKQYQELAEVLKSGEVILNYPVDERLKQIENPYDTIALQVDGIDFRMDYAYFEGNYYVYFGIIPELLLYLPFRILTGKSLPNYIAGTIFSIFFVVGAFWVSGQIIIRYSKKISFIHYLMLSLSICCFSQVFYMVGRPDLYHIPIIAANAFTMLGIGAWITALNSEKKSTVFLAMGSFFMAMVAGCRPQMVLYSFVSIVIFYYFTIKERKIFSVKGWKNTMAFVLPYGIVAIPVCWYNWKRFGSIFEFGATLSLTTNDMNTRGFNWERVWNGVYSFLIQTPSTISEFPYIEKTNLDVYYMGRNMTEFTFGGLLVVNALAWIILYFLFVEKKKELPIEYKAFCIVLLTAALIIALFDANGAGILQRYMGDLVPGITLGSVLCWSYYLDKERSKKERIDNFSKIFMIFFLLNITYSFLMLFVQGDKINLYDNHPILYHQVRTYFEL